MAREGQSRGAATRERVLDEASKLFIEVGYTKAPLSELSARLGITKAALYYYFQSKDELLLALVAPFFDEVDRLLADADRGAGLDKEEFLRRYVEVLRSDQRAVSIIGTDFTVSSHPDIEPRINAHVGAIIDLLAGPGADVKQLDHASAAMTIVQRGLFAHAGEPVELRSMPQDERMEIVLKLAMDVIAAG